jgi:hypothetical protein
MLNDVLWWWLSLFSDLNKNWEFGREIQWLFNVQFVFSQKSGYSGTAGHIFSKEFVGENIFKLFPPEISELRFHNKLNNSTYTLLCVTSCHQILFVFCIKQLEIKKMIYLLFLDHFCFKYLWSFQDNDKKITCLSTGAYHLFKINTWTRLIYKWKY